MCELLTSLSHSYDIYSEFEVSLLYTLGLCALHYALQAWLEEKTNVALSLFISFCAVDQFVSTKQKPDSPPTIVAFV
jgi:hypothetical protein